MKKIVLIGIIVFFVILSGCIENSVGAGTAVFDKTKSFQILEKFSTSSCIDSDGGKYVHMAGETCAGEVCRVDFCINNNESVIEQSCKKSTIERTTYDCSFGCSNGACNGSTPLRCTDPDNSNSDFLSSLNVQTTVKTFSKEFSSESLTDTCLENNSSTVREYKCDELNQIAFTDYNCPNGCENGTCIEGPTLEVCSDGTPVGECSQTKPLYCEPIRGLREKCESCGCEEGLSCAFNGACVEPGSFDDCLELIKLKNNPDATDRVNIVFVGIGYASVTEFIERARDVVNKNGDGSIEDTGLLAEYPFRDYPDSFNLWYANEVLPFNQNTFSNDAYSLAFKCPILNNEQIVVLAKEGFRSHARPQISFNSDEGDLTFLRWVALHEFGHAFGDLGDEYLVSTNPNPQSFPPTRVNCDVVSEDVACSKWCEGPPAPLETFTGDCIARDPTSCQDLENPACEWVCVSDCDARRNMACINTIETCTGISSADNCQNKDYCAWTDYVEPFFQSQCIPLAGYELNIGTNCVADTGCFKVCNVPNHYSSSENSNMRSTNQPYRFINEQELIRLLEELGQGIQSTIQNVIFYDEFDEKGKIIKGGIIEFDLLDEITTQKLVKAIEQKTLKKVPLKTTGKIDASKVNALALINEYEKIKEGVIKEFPEQKPTTPKVIIQKCPTQGIISDEKYCDSKGNWQKIKEVNGYCENNFECKTNYCSKNICMTQPIKEKPIFEQIINWIGGIFTKR